MSRRVLNSSSIGFGVVFATSIASAHPRPPDDLHAPPPPPPMVTQRGRPPIEYTTWISLGGGALVAPELSAGVFDMRAGADFTLGIGRKDDLRLGPFAEVGTETFASVRAIGGVELFFGAIPRPLRMFLYSGEGTLAVRLGAGYAWRSDDLPGAHSTPVASLTLAYGYRCPFSLREPEDRWSTPEDRRARARYMIGVRLWVNTVVDLRDSPSWQLTGGIEFEPVGSFRYLLGLY